MRHSRKGQIGTWLMVVIAAAVIGLAVFVFRAWLRPTLTVTDAVEGPVVQAFYATGTIQPQREFPIKSNGAGTITEVLVDKGDRVKIGQKLAMVADPQLIYAVDKAKAELNEKMQRADESTSPVLAEFDSRLSATNDLLEIAKREQNRIAGMVQGNAASQTDLDRAMDRFKQLWSESESLKSQKATKKLELQREADVAKAALSTAQWNLDQQTLKSPIEGVVLDRPVSLGTRLAVNEHIMQIADVRPENLVMRAAVDEEDKNKVHLDQPVRMTLYSFPDQVLAGKVTRIYDKADAERRTFEVDVTMDEMNSQLSAGMTGELAFIMATKDKAVVIPAQSYQGGLVYVVNDHRLKKIEPKIGLRSVERIEVTEGIAPGEKVVVSPVAGLADGQVVRTDFLSPEAAAGLNKPKVAEGSFKGFK